MILAGDIGATKTLLAIYNSSTMQPLVQYSYSSTAYAHFDELLQTFLHKVNKPHIAAMCLGVAGPVLAGSCQTLNLPWTLHVNKLQQQTHCMRVQLLNDLEAMGHGIQHLSPTDYDCLTPELPAQQGNIALLAAGTGLGEAFLYWDGSQHHVIATEGGHTDFAPQTELEIELLRFLQRQYQHVSYERLLSGVGLFQIYQFLCEYDKQAEEPEITRQLQTVPDPSALISQFAMTRHSVLCTRALDIFMQIYGAEAGNMALKVLSYGGVYLGGGIAPKILTALQTSYFLQAFRAKGRYQVINAKIPVYVILNQQIGLLGAAWYAKTHL
ncbi:glucokinase [Beggiatoa alba B18LD]|uniref:Glucokinase n=1 Tax=Beggiatoa alba B18LD TaxID=395493 RepID=I3CKY2_9GAMM|nr:glucokinase [Beggiatoa alba]EIJ44275.1 glucokinase [Beggiatoa alba B18LD]